MSKFLWCLLGKAVYLRFSIDQDAIHTERVSSGRDIFAEEFIGEFMLPVVQKKRTRFFLSLKKLSHLMWTGSQALERSESVFGRMDDDRATDPITVVSAVMGMVPVEAVLIIHREAISEVLTRRYRDLVS